MLQNTDRNNICMESDERRRCLSEASFEGLVIHDRGRVMEVNNTFADMFAFKHSEIIGMHALQFVTPEFHDLVLQNIITGYEGPYEAVCLRKNGSTFIGEIRCKNILYHGRMASVVAIRDITWIKQAEEEWRKSNSNLSILYRVSSAITQTLNLDTLFDVVLDTVIALDIFNVERKGGIFIIEGENMKLVSHRGHPKVFLKFHNDMKVGKCLCGLAAKTGEIIISRNSDCDTRHTINYPGMYSHGHIIIPLKARYMVAGVLYLYLPADSEIDESGLNLLASIGNQIGMAIDNAKLYEETRALSLLGGPCSQIRRRRIFDPYF